MRMPLKHNFSGIDRTYETARSEFNQAIPGDFNFAFDVIDDRALNADKAALICFDADRGNRRDVSFSDLADASTRFAQALKRLGLGKGDHAAVVAGGWPNGMR